MVKRIGRPVCAVARGIRGHWKSGVQLIGPSPEFARYKTTRLAEYLEMIIIEDMWLSLNIKFSKGKRSAFNLR